MQSEKVAIIALVVIIAGALSIYLTAAYGGDIWENFFNPEKPSDKNTIQLGDCADVNYIGRFHSNGTVFDTSYENVAQQSGIYDENRTYEPLKIFVNPFGNLSRPKGYENYSSSMIQGFLEGLIGMKKGENKTVSIPPEKAYGIWNESLARDYGLSPYPIDSVIKDIWDFDKSLFSAYFPDVNLTVNTTFDWGAKMMGVNNTLQATIINITDTNVTYKLLPQNGTTFTMPLFNWTVTILVENETHFTLHTATGVGYTTSINFGYGYLHIKVVDMNETDLKLAINSQAPSIKFIGQTLDFTLEVMEVYKTSQEES